VRPVRTDAKRDLFKRVISCMTVRINVSPAFSEMVMCLLLFLELTRHTSIYMLPATSDVVLKKMCNLYVGNYARCNPDLALLTINFLQKDCHDQDPTIRGLALRSLCSLRVQNLVEYLVAPLAAGLKDHSSYVRTVAAIGVLKLYHISATTCHDSDFPTALKALMLSDPDAQVMLDLDPWWCLN
jgi:vesicle coat complex subunit